MKKVTISSEVIFSDISEEYTLNTDLIHLRIAKMTVTVKYSYDGITDAISSSDGSEPDYKILSMIYDVPLIKIPVKYTELMKETFPNSKFLTADIKGTNNNTQTMIMSYVDFIGPDAEFSHPSFTEVLLHNISDLVNKIVDNELKLRDVKYLIECIEKEESYPLPSISIEVQE